MKILIVDDERDIRQILRILLEKQGYEVLEATNGRAAVAAVAENADLDLCIMDIMMPQMDGIEATEHIRKLSNLPVLFLTAKSLHDDRVKAYASGGDDYLVKPFVAQELLLKVEAMTRRYNSYRSKAEADAEEILAVNDEVTIYPQKREVQKRGVVIDMRDKEYDVLMCLLKHRGRTLAPNELYQAVWEEMPLPSSSNTVTVHVLNLRRKLEDNPSTPKLIRTVWGKGYQID